MIFIPEEELKAQIGINFAPMIDFLFLMVAFFACLAISRIATKDTDIELVKMQSESNNYSVSADLDYQFITINILKDGHYNWMTEIKDYPLMNANHIYEELKKQYEMGLLPNDKHMTQVLLKIDKDATWEPILKAIFAVREAGFEVRPVYEPDQFIQNRLPQATKITAQTSRRCYESH